MIHIRLPASGSKRRRRPDLLVVSTVVAVLSFAQAAAAQQRADLPEKVQALVHRAEPTLDLSTRATVDGRRDARRGIDRAWYRIGEIPGSLGDTSPVEQRTPDELRTAGSRFLSVSAERFGWAAADPDLEPVSVRRGINTAHVTYEQRVGELPVYGRLVKVSLDAQGQPTFVISGYDVDLPGRMRQAGLVGTRLQPSLSAERARAAAAELFELPSVGGEYAEGSLAPSPRLVVLPDETPRVAWVVSLLTDDYPGDWEVLVDAHDGSIIRVRDRAIRRHAESASAVAREVAPATFVAQATDPIGVMFDESARAIRVDGSGNAFEPDPLTSAGVMYGPPFVDDNDADIAALNGQLMQVPLRDITLGGDNIYRLSGPHVTIAGGGPLNYTVPGEPSPDGFSYSRGNDGFEAVNTYYHVDQSQRYVQSLGFTEVRADGLTVNPQGIIGDNSLYLPSANRINFGIGGVDDGEDAGVIWHEYGHALLEDAAPGLIDGANGQALHEGWADYWATSYMRGLTEAGKSLRLDWQKVFRWDSGDGAIWPGRAVGIPGVYPDDTTCEDDGDSQHDGCDIYHDGLIWASTLMEIYDGVGKSVSDRLNVQSHAYLAPGASARDAAEALLQADQDLFGGEHTGILESRLAARGYIEAVSQAPYLEHEPLNDTEATGTSVTLTVVAISATTSIDSVRVVFSIGGEDEQALLLQPVDATHFERPLALPAEPGDVMYRFEAFDAEGRMSVLPQNPAQHYSFFVGPDTKPPGVVHDPIETVSTVAWPPVVSVLATDNIGVAGVVVSYELRAAGGTLLTSGDFDLDAGVGPDTWIGAFPIDRSVVLDESTIDYSILVTDAAQASNTSREPESGAHRIDVRSSGTLLSFDFEQELPALQPSGTWVRGAPGSPLHVAHSGSALWSTGAAGPYPDAPQLSTLELPPLDLTATAAYLVFWHWHDFEHEGTVLPGEDNSGATLWDGGNVKLSVDGGPWEVAAPVGGYTGVLASDGENPLSGESAFGGYSFGWRRDIVALPAGPDIRVRFDFGTNDGNSETSVGYGGWYIDDVLISTDLPVDDEAPVLEVAPEQRIIQSTDASFVALGVQAVDNTGIERLELAVESGAELLVSPVRFAMELSDLNGYQLVLTMVGAEAGDSLVYRLRLRDFDGNETIVPTAGVDPFVVVFRTVESADVLAQAVGSGAWTRTGSTWRASATAPAPGRVYSGLVLAPLAVPENTEASRLLLNHGYVFASGSGGNVKISADDGSTWSVLTPEGGYDDEWQNSDDHPMRGEPIYQGAGFESIEVFDVSAYRGRSIRIRLDAGFPGGTLDGAAATSYWRVESLAIESVSADDEIEVPEVFSLDANFPDPFADVTTITYTLPSEDLVMLALFDVLGRRVQVLRFSVLGVGTHTEQLTADGLPNGVYFLRLTAGPRAAIERVTVVR